MKTLACRIRARAPRRRRHSRRTPVLTDGAAGPAAGSWSRRTRARAHLAPVRRDADSAHRRLTTIGHRSASRQPWTAAPRSPRRVGTQTPIVQTVFPDGTGHPISEDGCTGTQRAEWSADGLRLYARAELTCKDDQGIRRVSGLALIGPDGRWTDMQAVDVSGRESFRVRKYRRVDGAAVMPSGSRTALTLEDVKEAIAKVSPRAVEAALVETRASFDLTSKHLLDLERRRRSRQRRRSHRGVVLP